MDFDESYDGISRLKEKQGLEAPEGMDQDRWLKFFSGSTSRQAALSSGGFRSIVSSTSKKVSSPYVRPVLDSPSFSAFRSSRGELEQTAADLAAAVLRAKKVGGRVRVTYEIVVEADD